MPRITGSNSSGTDYTVRATSLHRPAHFLAHGASFDITIDDSEVPAITAQLNTLSGVTYSVGFVAALSTAAGTIIRKSYTATGSEGTDITLSIGVTMPSTGYGVVWAEKGNSGGGPVSDVAVVDLPTSSRTTTTFRVVFSVQPNAGDQFEFLLTP